jgi:hypothetical protein
LYVIRCVRPFGKSSARVVRKDASDMSHQGDDQFANHNIWQVFHPVTGLRALWTEWSVEVRVLSGALKRAPLMRVSDGPAIIRQRYAVIMKLVVSGLPAFPAADGVTVSW